MPCIVSAWCFFAEGDPAARGSGTWPAPSPCWTDTLGPSQPVFADGPAPHAHPEAHEADQAAKYLVNKADYLDYPTALAAGWPISRPA